MKKFTQRRFNDWIVFATVFFTALTLTTFDSFSFDTVTTAAPLITVAGVGFYRMEFVALVFSLCFALGLIAGKLTSKYQRSILPFCVTFLGIIAAFFAVFDVDLLQTLVPDMRISHVTMTLSQVDAVVLGACGVPVGIVFARPSRQSASAAAAAAVCAGVAAVIALSEKCYASVYALAAVVIIVTGLTCELSKPDAQNIEREERPSRFAAAFHAARSFIGIFGLVFILIASYPYITLSQRSSAPVYAVTAVSAVALFFISPKLIKDKAAAYFSVFAIAVTCSIINLFICAPLLTFLSITSTALLFGANNAPNEFSAAQLAAAAAAVLSAVICAVIANRCLSEIIEYSANRIYYLPTGTFFAISIAAIAIESTLTAVFRIRFGTRKRSRPNSEN